jgi:hypothetical protein
VFCHQSLRFTPLPEENRLTVIALTSQAGQLAASPTLKAVETTETPPDSSTPPPQTPTLAGTTPVPQAATETVVPAPGGLSPELGTQQAPFIPPGLPNNTIEIRNLGPLSRVTSPIHVWGYLKTGAGSQARIELLGEDHRLLYGETKAFNVPEGAHAVLSLDIDYEITAPAEAGRLQIWVQDPEGRVTALNSVPLILLSYGEADINTPTDLLDPIVIQQPGLKALIQGGSLVVAGLARVDPGATLLARLITPEGRQVGQRLVEVSAPPEGGYGEFAAEVPYQVKAPTPALLVVSQGEVDLQDIIHLSSVEVLLGP